jgi:serine/threonine protein kinase
MLTLLSRLDVETNLSMNAPSLFVLDDQWNITDFLCSRLNLNVMSDIKDHSLLEEKALSAVRYLDTLHKLNIFHGDIKPQNFFYLKDLSCKYALRKGDKKTLSSDCGTLTILDPDDSDKTYLITQYTPAFSSKAHDHAV